MKNYRNLVKNIKRKFNLESKLKRKIIGNIEGKSSVNALSKRMIIIFAVLGCCMSMLSAFAEENLSQKIDAIGINENGDSFFEYESFSEHNLENGSDCKEDFEDKLYLGDEENYNENEDFFCKRAKMDSAVPGFEYIERTRNQEFQKWCELNIKLIKEENMSRNIAYNRFYYEKHKDKVYQRHRKYVENNKSQIKEYKKNYLDINKEKIREQQKKYRETNKEKIRELQKEYRETNREKIRELQKEYRKTNKEKIRELRKEYRKTNKEKTGQIKEYIKKCNENHKEEVKECKKKYGVVRKVKEQQKIL